MRKCEREHTKKNENQPFCAQQGGYVTCSRHDIVENDSSIDFSATQNVDFLLRQLRFGCVVVEKTHRVSFACWQAN